MTATEKAKRSDALYYETVSVNRRVLCDMIANREADLEDAKAENARLLEQVDAAHMSRLLTENENESLRELVRDMWFWHYEGHIDSESQERQMLHIDAVIQRMRELWVDE